MSYERGNELRMKNLRETDPNYPDVHEDFVIRHAHLSRVEEKELKRLIDVSDFCIGQVSGRINNCSEVKRGSQYFIEDLTKDKKVRRLFEMKILNRGDSYYLTIESFSRSDIVKIYNDRA